MGQLALTFTVIFSLFLVLSHARTPVTQSSNLVAEFQPSTISSESHEEETNPNVNNNNHQEETLQTIRLPTDRSESQTEHEPETVEPEHEHEHEHVPEHELEHEHEHEHEDVSDSITDSESDSIPIDEHLQTSENTDHSVPAVGMNRPLTITYDIGVHPIDRHVHHLHMKHPYWNRFPHRCRHHGMQMGQSTFPREVPYGNDMVLSNARAFDQVIRSQYFARHFGKPMFPARVKPETTLEEEGRHVEESKPLTQTPLKLNKQDEHVEDKSKHAVGKPLTQTPLTIGKHNEHVDGGDMVYVKPMESKKGEEVSFMNKVRKFLDHF